MTVSIDYFTSYHELDSEISRRMTLLSKKNILYTAACIIIIAELFVYYLVTHPNSLRHISLTLSYHPPSVTEQPAAKLPELIIDDNIDLVDLSLLLPHTPLRQTRYLMSIVTPRGHHLTLPGLNQSTQGRSGFDTFNLTVDKNYFFEPNGLYTIVLTELFLEDPGSQTPGVYLYPLRVISK